jgi:hypothetical protein
MDQFATVYQVIVLGNWSPVHPQMMVWCETHSIFWFCVLHTLHVYLCLQHTTTHKKTIYPPKLGPLVSSLPLLMFGHAPRPKTWLCGDAGEPTRTQLSPCHSRFHLQISPQRTTRFARGDGWQQGSFGQRTHRPAPGRPVVASLPAFLRKRCCWPSAAGSAIPVELQSRSPSWWRDPSKIRRLAGGRAITRAGSVEAVGSEAPTAARAPTL